MLYKWLLFILKLKTELTTKNYIVKITLYNMEDFV